MFMRSVGAQAPNPWVLRGSSTHGNDRASTEKHEIVSVHFNQQEMDCSLYDFIVVFIVHLRQFLALF